MTSSTREGYEHDSHHLFHKIAYGRAVGRTRKYIKTRKICRRSWQAESAIIVSFFIIVSRSQFKHNYSGLSPTLPTKHICLWHKAQGTLTHTRVRHMLCTECSLRGRASRTVSYRPNNNRGTHVPCSRPTLRVWGCEILCTISLARVDAWSGLWFPVRYAFAENIFGQLDIYGCVFVSMFMIIMRSSSKSSHGFWAHVRDGWGQSEAMS